jgi:hypothetical protein
MELRDLIARVTYENALSDMDMCGIYNADDVADAILTALDAAGLVVVPREPTEEMAKAGKNAFMPPTTFVSYTTSMAEAWVHMIAASPFAKKEVE